VSDDRPSVGRAGAGRSRSGSSSCRWRSRSARRWFAMRSARDAVRRRARPRSEALCAAKLDAMDRVGIPTHCCYHVLSS
jgi:hypothetical protein